MMMKSKFKDGRRSIAATFLLILVGLALIASGRGVFDVSDDPVGHGIEPANLVSTGTPHEVSQTSEGGAEEDCAECEIRADQMQALSTMTAKIHAQARSEDASASSVRAVLFWMEGCPHCHDVIANVLPALERKYYDSLEILLVEIESQEQVDALFSLAGSLGIPKERVGVPFLMIGDQVLIGSVEIPERLPELVESYHQAGGAALPGTPGLESLMQSGRVEEFTLADTPVTLSAASIDESFSENPNGHGLAIAVLAGMAALLIYGVWALLREVYDGHAWLPPDSWTKFIPVLVLIGIGVAVYLSYIETQQAVAVCGPVGDCNAVQQSEYAVIFGIPVGVLGLAGYVLMLVAWWIGKTNTGTKLANWARLALLGLTAAGLLFSMYLTYLEPFVIKAVCLWCLSSSVVIAGLFLLSLPGGIRMLKAWVERD